MKFFKTPFFIPLLIFALFTPFSPWIDMEVAKLFYFSSETPGFWNNAFLAFLFKWGEKTGFVIGGIAGFFYLLSWISNRFRKWRRATFFLILTPALAAGLIVNGGLKEIWGRPRPKQVLEFGGRHEYRPFYHPKLFHKEEPQKSFPSGHVTIGFYYLTFAILARHYRQRKLFLLSMAFVAFWGGGLAFSRVAQGGHFVSDALFAILIMWFTALLIFEGIFIRKITWGRLTSLWDGDFRESSSQALKYDGP